MRVLRIPYTLDLELLQFIEVTTLKLPTDSYQSLEDIMESTSEGYLTMMLKAINQQYTVMLRYLLAVGHDRDPSEQQ